MATQPSSSDSLPSFDRMLKVAAGSETWTPDELGAKRRQPFWCITQAKACLTLAMLEQTPEGIRARLQQAAGEIAQLPSIELNQAAHRYLQTFLSESLRTPFATLVSSAQTAAYQSQQPDDVDDQPISPQPSKFEPQTRSHRRRLLQLAAIGLVMTSIGYLAWRSGHNPFAQVVSAPPSSYARPTLTNPIDQAGRPQHAAGPDVLFLDDELLYRDRHPQPMEFQWLVHIDREAMLVAFNDKQGELEFVRPAPQWLPDETWRYEFFVVVTSSRTSDTFPRSPKTLPKRLATVTPEDISRLQATDNLEEQQQILVECLTRDLGGPREASIYFTRYRNQNQLRR